MWYRYRWIQLPQHFPSYNNFDACDDEKKSPMMMLMLLLYLLLLLSLLPLILQLLPLFMMLLLNSDLAAVDDSYAINIFYVHCFLLLFLIFNKVVMLRHE